MSVNLSVNELNYIINSRYSFSSPTSELGQLGLLFSADFIDDFVALLYKSTRRNIPNNSLVTLQVSFGWIDKVPLAKFHGNQHDHNGHKITKKVEIGDMHFVFNDKVITKKIAQAPVMTNSAYGLIIQAKRSPSLSLPIVPVTNCIAPNSSTAKEFHLLNLWPVFDLYKTSKSNSSIFTGIDLNNNITNRLSYGWYAACPPSNNLTSDWLCRWMCSPAQLGSECDLTLGRVLSAFYDRTKLGNIQVGVEFDISDDWSTTANKLSFTPWSKLNNEMIDICKSLNMPSVAKVKSKRIINKTITHRAIFSTLSLLYTSNPQLLQEVLKRILGERFIEDSELKELFDFLEGEGFTNEEAQDFVGDVFERMDKDLIKPHLSSTRNMGDDLTQQELQRVFEITISNIGINDGSKNKGYYVLNVSRTIQVIDDRDS